MILVTSSLNAINAITKLQDQIKMGNEVSLQKVEGQGEKKCPECGSDRIVRKDNEIYCRKCGFVID